MSPTEARTASAVAPNGGVVISQVYGGGGNALATYQNDFVELYNAGTTTVNLSTWSVQYASAAGTGAFAAQVLNGSIQPGQYYLVKLKSTAAVGDTLPTANATGTLDLSGTAGKVILANQATGIGCNGGSIACTPEQLSHIMDLVGYGSTANFFEGATRAPAPSNTSSIMRKDGGRQDNDLNGSDFEVKTAPFTPRNTLSPFLPPLNTPPAVVASVTIAPATASVNVGATTSLVATAKDAGGITIPGVTFTWTTSDANIATVSGTGVVTGVAVGPVTITASTTNGTSSTAAVTVTPAPVVIPPAPGLVISQVYGGGGNGGAVYTNDFIELYNGGTAAVDLSGWSVQYSSASSTAPVTWTRTALSGTVQPGHYFLIQESAGANIFAPLPTPDFVPATADNTLLMGATGGRIALVRGTTALTSLCPATDATTQDFVGYGAANCFEGSGPTAATANATAAIRKDGGRQDTNANVTDFTVGTPAPRNSSTYLAPLHVLAAIITPGTPAAMTGTTIAFTATAAQFGAPVAVSSAAWTSSNPAVATIDPATGVASAIATGTTTIGVTVTTPNGTATSSTTLTVSAAPAVVTVSPATWFTKAGTTKAFTASAVDVSGSPTSSTYTWTSSNPLVATIDATGLATGVSAGTVTITATSANGIAGTATLIVTVGNVSVQPRPAADGPLPTGFQTQMFLNAGSTDAAGQAVFNSTVTWSSSDPSIVSIDPRTGVVTAIRAGTVIITATANSDNLSSGSTTLTTKVPDFPTSIRLGHNTELGLPTDADPSDDVIIARRTYTLSYNVAHGGPNWVSWNLDASHKSGAARCNCMTADTALTRLGIRAFTTAEWVGGGWSRGHMSPSADWLDSDGDNASTFFMSNMVPQNQTANGGAWGDFEDYLRTRAVGSTEIYIVAGPIFTKNRKAPGVDGFGFLDNGTPIAVPDSTWKIAVIVPDTRSASQIGAPTDVEVIAVNMENSVATTGSWNQTKYRTTIAKLEASTGYNLLSALPENIQCKLEVRNCLPSAAITGVAAGNEGQTLTFSGATSSDADNDALSYSWSLNGAPVGSNAGLTYTFAQDGNYTLSLTVTDGKGGTSTVSTTVAIANVAPVVATFAGATINEGGTYTSGGTFADPGNDGWSATVDYGDGSGAQPLALSGKGFSLSHAYADNGSYTVTVTVTETAGGTASHSASATVTVNNVAPVVAPFSGATILRNSGYTSSSGFSDPGTDTQTATVNYGDGTPTSALALTGTTFTLQHVYTTAGTYTVTVSVTDEDGATGTRTATVVVQTTLQGIPALIASVNALGGTLTAGEVTSLRVKLTQMGQSLRREDATPAGNQLDAFVNEVNAMVRSGRLTDAAAAPLLEYAALLKASLE